ncbi:hypothetical protein A2380_01560 [candidate division WWE3 bacterium RIFOXYB1_FULL_43_24]|uniref:Transcriptional regulator, PadR-like protein family n=1 Tax=candidate division WWE3 bacterium GW2011_GWF1_42_14 TaxID=1619138 RepID=A0A0G0YM14_UNCKA|nr:MAG: Transcriptional regulator, PadR-like protein family [candidate division WWE3 bacterium GW2011_GWA1_42_12]KKS34539.1 MAG: Transcriptional regulator, PadR-like protein family [candidate division WWE3 bacterium GW2011_GWD1_42_14]KKS37720.1 MAG: Transcriptional regulator, PadR-like protein family [candidate division WWE3 bacterium GW2011_GWF1_42_14]KKS40163.1 MAG: Transcriptional regulator, PadR-like protein family [candidate division WWE3 bacterium GW2011_GWE1_42_16]OGC68814.1 MAG: hypothe
MKDTNKIKHENGKKIRCPEKDNTVNKKFGYPERGWIQLLILRHTYEKPLYGYDLMKILENTSRTTSKVKSGSMYTALRRMEEQGLLKSKWATSDLGPERRMYFPTKKGTEYLKNWLHVISDRIGVVDELINFYKDRFHE